MASRAWYAKKNDRELGPFSSRELKRMAARNEIVGSDQIRRSDLHQWIAAEKVKGLFPAMESPLAKTAAASAFSSRLGSPTGLQGSIERSTEVFYRRAGRQVGPLTFAVLKQLAGASLLKPSDDVRIGRDGDWIEAARVPGLVPLDTPSNGAGSVTLSQVASVPPHPPLPAMDGHSAYLRAEVAPPRVKSIAVPPPIPMSRGASRVGLPSQKTRRKSCPVPPSQGFNKNDQQGYAPQKVSDRDSSVGSEDDGTSSLHAGVTSLSGLGILVFTILRFLNHGGEEILRHGEEVLRPIARLGRLCRIIFSADSSEEMWTRLGWLAAALVGLILVWSVVSFVRSHRETDPPGSSHEHPPN